jgi:AraC-like DNA-binding protein
MVLLDNGGRRTGEVDLLAPPGDLAGVVEHSWIDDERRPRTADWRVVADTSPHLIAIVHASGRGRAIRVALVGARSCAATLDMRRRLLTVGVRLRPGALPVLTDVSARELADRSTSVDQIFGTQVLSDLELGPDTPPAVILQELLRLTRRACRSRAVRPLLPDAASPGTTVGEMARWLATPSRSLRERVHREVGLSPKHMLRVLRLHAALHVARRADHSWSQVACAAGYADQAHLTRELRMLLGETPSAWRARGSAVSFKTPARDVG